MAWAVVIPGPALDAAGKAGASDGIGVVYASGAALSISRAGSPRLNRDPGTHWITINGRDTLVFPGGVERNWRYGTYRLPPVVTWVDDGLMYYLRADLPLDRLLEMARSIE